ncbi:MAG: T9SS type A sorting domain-containing protein [Bacteroidetes bacterium]|nr:T9SS type A sorting domain-containing protein [Bacteroidota bacterium]
MRKLIHFCFAVLLSAPFLGQAQTMGTEMSNGGLEDWNDTLLYPQLEGWWDSHNNWGIPNNITDYGLEKTFLNVQEGLFAAELETKIGDVFTLDLFRKYIPGVLTNGNCVLTSAAQLQDERSINHDEFIFGGEAFEGMLDKVTGFYEYSPAAGGDSAYFYARLWKADGTVVAEGTLFASAAVSDYTAFEIPITYSVMEEADSLLLIFASSHKPRAATVGSRLFLDNLAFVFTEPDFVDSYAEQQGIAIRLFPNPATVSITLENPYFTPVQVSVFNALGQQVLLQQLQPGLNEVSVAALAPGAHLYRMTTTEKLIANGTFVVR